VHFKLKGLTKVFSGYNPATGNLIYFGTKYNIFATERKLVKVNI